MSKQYIILAIAIQRFFMARTYPAHTVISRYTQVDNLFFPSQKTNDLPTVSPDQRSETVLDKTEWDHLDTCWDLTPRTFCSKLYLLIQNSKHFTEARPLGKVVIFKLVFLNENSNDTYPEFTIKKESTSRIERSPSHNLLDACCDQRKMYLIIECR
jgi:hypothetical protein